MADKKKGYMIFWIIIAVIAVVFLSQFVFSKNAPQTQQTVDYGNSVSLEGMDSFAQCLTQSGAIFYGTEWCPHCKAQKEMFGDSLKYVNYIDCDANQAACVSAGIQGYPTWQINGGNDLVGTQQLSSLAAATGCTLA